MPNGTLVCALEGCVSNCLTFLISLSINVTFEISVLCISITRISHILNEKYVLVDKAVQILIPIS
jgi:hypothetical protein